MRPLLLVFLLLVVTACPSQPSADDTRLAAVRLIHGGAGPWVMLGERMGERALVELGLPKGSFDLEVTHHGPEKVQYTCVADGAAAATGASVGKLNLHLETAEQPSTTFRNRRTGAAITLAPADAFIARFKDLPREQLDAAGQEVLHLPEAELFQVVR